MTSATRLQEIKKCVEQYGYDLAAEKLGLKKETVRRKVREYKANIRMEPGKEVTELPKASILEKLGQAFTDDELTALWKSSQKHFDSHHKSEHKFSGQWTKFGVMSDLHIGSNYTNEAEIAYALDEFKRNNCELVLCPGDVTEGMSGRDGHIYELTHIGYKAQRNAAVSVLSKWDGPFKAISGNHDLWFASKANIGALIVEDICSALPNGEYLGEHEGSIYFNGARVDLWHGEDGSSYALSYRIQKIVESIEGGNKPNMIIAGHDHKAEYIPNLRNIQAIEAGCIEHQTPWMRRKKLSAYCGFWIIEICVNDSQIVKVRTEWTPLYH